jgi:hypothetical protein
MKNIILPIAIISITLTLGAILPRVWIKHSPTLAATEIACGQRAASEIFDNSVEPRLILETAVVDKRLEPAYSKQQAVIYTNAYTLFGVTYGTVTSLCDSQTGQVECAGRVYLIWDDRFQGRKRNQPCG